MFTCDVTHKHWQMQTTFLIMPSRNMAEWWVGGIPHAFVRVLFVHGRSRSWSISGGASTGPDLISEILFPCPSCEHLVLWIRDRYFFYTVDSAVLMHISLNRFCQCDPQDQCVFATPICGSIQTTLFAFLSTAESHRVTISCIFLLADRSDIFLRVTEFRLGLALTSFSVPTPPLARWSAVAISDVWNTSDSSDDA